MRAAVIIAPGRVDVRDVGEPSVSQPDEVVIEVAASGICGTDLHILHGEEGRLPVTPGHEFAGTVVSVGSSVTTLATGDRVCADPNIPCRSCAYCQDGRVHLCENYTAVGVTRDGAAAQFVRVPAELCVRVPDQVPLEYAAFAEPLACAIHAMDLLELKTGQSALVVGAGTMGLALLQLLRSGGAASVDVVDTNATKLDAATELGAFRQSHDMRQLDSGRGWDVVVDATGSLSAIQDGLTRVARGGTFLQFGVAVPGGRVEIDPHRIYDDELRILGAVCPSNAYRRAVQYLACGRFDVEPLISHRLPLEDYPGAIEAFGRGETKKVLIQPNG